ncbi:MAG TPA: TetR-like C-terminal domain-containing protein [Solirubrobacteraceae bacterium]|nr:TetR-like C-terminal domain-containing protein [Solirubrobacteraceae bacterium]
MPRAGLSPAAVVDAAAALADAQGLEALTLAKIAATVGVRAPSLYNHVASLGDVRRRLALRALSELAAAMRDAAVGRAGDDALVAMAHAYRDYATRHPGRYAATQRAPAEGDEEHAAAAAAAVDVLLAILRGYDLESDDAIHAARGVRSALHGFVALEAGGGFGLPVALDTSFERMVAALARGLRGSGRADPS